MENSPSVIDSHPQRTKIIEGILAGRSVREIANSVSPRVSRDTVWRYRKTRTDLELKNVLMEHQTQQESGVAMRQVRLTGGEISLMPSSAVELARNRLLNRLGEHHNVIDGRLYKSKSDNGIASLVNADRGSVEAEARLLGLLQDQTQNTVLVMAAPGSSVTIQTGSSAPAAAVDAADTTLDLEPGEYTE